MRVKIGRNEPCPCGSGKKHKKCCLAISSSGGEVLDFGWRKLRKTEGSVIDNHLRAYLLEELDKDAHLHGSSIVMAALEEMLPEGLPEGMDEVLFFTNFFMPWLLFNWVPSIDLDINNFDFEKTIAQNYLLHHENKLTRDEKRFIKAMNATYYSFYSVLDVEFERALTVKDRLLGTKHHIKEFEGTKGLKRGDVVFSRILTLDEQSIFVGMAPVIVPTQLQGGLQDFKDFLIEDNDNKALDGMMLRNEFDLVVLDYFFQVMEAAFNPSLPTLTNTNGELIQLSTSYYALTISPKEALTKLLPLTLSKKPNEFLENAELDMSGSIKRIEFPWLKKGNKQNKSWDNTVMGHITVEVGRLTLETNSEERSNRGKKLLEKHLADAISFQNTLIETPEQKLKKYQGQNGTLNQQLILESPEVQEQIKQLAQAHWDNWFDEPIPALKGKTPRDAAKTADGRERLEDLLLQYERQDIDNSQNNLFNADIEVLSKLSPVGHANKLSYISYQAKLNNSLNC